MKPFWVTTSWDDGDSLDLRVADYLDHYGLRGTFYISRECSETSDRLSEGQIAELAARHEIGAHTLTHAVLTQIDVSAAQQEIIESRHWLEMITGRPITAFCYPKGRFDRAVRRLVAEAGFEVGRTVLPYQFDLGGDPLTIPTTIQVYPFPFRPVRRRRAALGPIRIIRPYLSQLKIPVFALRSWRTLALALLDRAAAVGGVWHLWGHSWEIDKYRMWPALERVLAAASRYPQARFVTNSDLVREISSYDARSEDVL